MSTVNSLKTRVIDDMKTAMRAGDKEALGAIRLILAAIKQVEVDTRKELEDAEILAVLDKMRKQRRESIESFQQAARQDLVDKELAELQIIERFLPQALSDAEVEALIESAVATTNAASLRDMGKVMALLKPQLQGRADISAVSGRIKARLGG
ncbi:MAG: GatB/YqeY domain-containing protein [Thiotrichales bacterium]